jgi:hypothetical protein
MLMRSSKGVGSRAPPPAPLELGLVAVAAGAGALLELSPMRAPCSVALATAAPATSQKFTTAIRLLEQAESRRAKDREGRMHGPDT